MCNSGYFLSHAFTHARFCKELDREKHFICQINGDFKKTLCKTVLVRRYSEKEVAWIFQDTNEFNFSDKTFFDPKACFP